MITMEKSIKTLCQQGIISIDGSSPDFP
jgi:hypothetical protein